MNQDTVLYDPLIYWEARAEHWLGQTHESPEWVEEIKTRLNPDWKVLELGCGDGRWSDTFDDYTGSDISSILLEEAQKRHPGKRFAHHDMREGVKGEWDLIFTFTAWLHMPPKDMAKVKLPPEARLMFVEPHGKPNSEHCFKHDYRKLFGCERVRRIGPLTMYGRGV